MKDGNRWKAAECTPLISTDNRSEFNLKMHYSLCVLSDLVADVCMTSFDELDCESMQLIKVVR